MTKLPLSRPGGGWPVVNGHSLPTDHEQVAICIFADRLFDSRRSALQLQDVPVSGPAWRLPDVLRVLLRI